MPTPSKKTNVYIDMNMDRQSPISRLTNFIRLRYHKMGEIYPWIAMVMPRVVFSTNNFTLAFIQMTELSLFFIGFLANLL